MYEYHATVKTVFCDATIGVMLDLGFSLFQKTRVTIHNVVVDGEGDLDGDIDKLMESLWWLSTYFADRDRHVIVQTHKPSSNGEHFGATFFTLEERLNINELMVNSGHARWKHSLTTTH